MDRYVLTIGIQKNLYVELAVNLALSFLYWHKDSNIKFQLVTDQPQLVPAYLQDKIEVITVEPEELGQGFSAKLHLDKLAKPGQTLFVDSDCLIAGRLDQVFQKFAGHAVSVAGVYIAQGEWFGDIESICNKFKVPHLPKFNGGIYYLEKGIIATDVYNTARELEKRYDEIGFVRLRNKPNDEVLMALAMQLNGQQPIADDGTIMSDPQACQGIFEFNVTTGHSLLVNPAAPDKRHQEWYPFKKVSPVIVHFLGDNTKRYQYLNNVYRLKKEIDNNPVILTESVVLLKKYLELTKFTLKGIFRPVYHLLMGVRKVKLSDRL